MNHLQMKFLRPLAWRRSYGLIQRGAFPRLSQRNLSSTTTSTNAITLRPYQEESIQAVLDYLERGERRLGISLATGAGKTVIFSQLIGRIRPPTPHATKTLILVHRRELVEQAARACVNAYPDQHVAIEMGKLHSSHGADITVASVQSLARGERLAKFNPAEYKLVLVDEAHHIVASAYLKVLAHFGLMKESSAQSQEPPFNIDEDDIDEIDSDALAETSDHRPGFEAGAQISTRSTTPSVDTPTALVGVSATFSRFDGLSLGHALDHIVYHKDYIDLIDEKWLSDVIFSTSYTPANLSNVRRKGGADSDFQTKSLSEAVNTDEINKITVQSWLTKAEGRRSTLVFCVDVAHAQQLTQKFRQHGIDAHYVSGKTTVARRSALVEAFRKDQFPVLLNVGVFTEGTDIPNIDCVLLARPTKSRNLLVQMIGRGMRLFQGKQNCHVIDMVSALQTGIMNVPTLLGLDPTALLDKASIGQIKEQKDMPAEAHRYVDGQLPDRSTTRTVNFKDYASVAEFIGDTSEEAHIRKLSRNAWVAVGPDKDGFDRHILSGTDRSTYLTIKDHGKAAHPQPRFRVTLVTKIPNTSEKKRWNATRPHLLAQAKTFEAAVHAADTWASNSSHFPRWMTDRSQPWRLVAATAAQNKYLESILRKSAITLHDMLYNKGQMSHILTKIRFGAKGRYEAILAAKGRRDTERQRAEKVEQRETVQVGPIA